jgi:hypothetical protein
MLKVAIRHAQIESTRFACWVADIG